jgi:anti-anti-sigma factor
MLTIHKPFHSCRLQVMETPHGSVAKLIPCHGPVGEDALGRLTRVVDAVSQGSLYVDLDSVDYLDSAEIGKLVCAHKRLRARGGQLVLCNVHPRTYGVFEKLMLHRLLDIRQKGVPTELLN